MSHEAYRRASVAHADPRDAEYRAIAEATRRLIDADAARRELKGLIEAVHFNRELWARLAGDCADRANRLAPETRARIIALARWVHSYSSEAVRTRKSLTPLIDLNRIIMDGLAGRASAA